MNKSQLAKPSLPLLGFLLTVGLAVVAPPSGVAEVDAADSIKPINVTTDIDDERLINAGDELSNWLTHGRTYSEQRYSPLEQINDKNIEDLRIVWDTPTGLKRGHEATPIVVDGVMFLTGSWSVVIALDAKTGEELWRHDPKVPKEMAGKACCDVVNRGVAVYKGHVYSGSLDGRLLCLDAADGSLVWEKVIVDQSKNYTITGAPRIVKGRVIIGNGGAELGVRGYVSAYDADDGEMVWRTYTVPGNPEFGFESDAIEKAAETWKGGKWWEIGGGGTVWDSVAFDPELDLLYIGTGNGSPWVRHERSPGGGDNLYLSSILALDPDTGELVWHYQTTPGDTWDYTATQHMILADLTIGTEVRKVLMQAPKNGFFYVLDRETGEFLSAKNFSPVTWATGVDQKTGRPIETEGADYKDKMAFVSPTPFGAHNWQPMSYSPKTGLVYIPAQEITGIYRREKNFKIGAQRWNTGTDFNVYSVFTPELARGRLVAWDPIKQEQAWSHYYAMAWNGGTLATGGNLVFQGTSDARLIAFAADSGKQLWEARTHTGVGAGPITYMVDGEQYIAVVAGYGGTFALAAGAPAAQAGRVSDGRVMAWRVYQPELPSLEAVAELLDKPGDLPRGERLYHKHCATCHGGQGISATDGLPDLRYTALPWEVFDKVLRDGLLRHAGMPPFTDWLTDDDTRLIKTWLESQREAGGPGR
ncbi:MAG: quinohemoprotein ethanol dehydrogenase [Hyphomicrobiaceae bacterium]|jgi:quinohemoprotein ethanol dehydrogenase